MILEHILCHNLLIGRLLFCVFVNFNLDWLLGKKTLKTLLGVNWSFNRSCSVQSFPVMSYQTLNSCSVLSCPVLSCPVLSSPVMSCLRTKRTLRDHLLAKRLPVSLPSSLYLIGWTWQGLRILPGKSYEKDREPYPVSEIEDSYPISAYRIKMLHTVLF